jgi:hypothetical protein
MINSTTNHPDEAIGKGAVEDDPQPSSSKGRPQNSSESGQLDHRTQDQMLKDNDTDFPGPDAEAEHTGG